MRRESTASTNVSTFLDQAYAAEYDRDRFGGRFGEYLQEREIRLFLGLLGGPQGPILDAGCGTGKLTLPLVTGGHQVTGTDLSKEMVAVAKGKCGDSETSARFSIADVRALCFGDRVFDSVVSSRMLMHVSEWREAMAELCRVAQRCIVVDFPPRLSFAGLDAWRKRRRAPPPGSPRQPYQTFSLREIREELARHGFRLVAVKRSHVLPTILHRKIDRPRISRAIEGLASVLGLRRLLGMPITVMAIRELRPGR